MRLFSNSNIIYSVHQCLYNIVYSVHHFALLLQMRHFFDADVFRYI